MHHSLIPQVHSIAQFSRITSIIKVLIAQNDLCSSSTGK